MKAQSMSVVVVSVMTTLFGLTACGATQPAAVDVKSLTSLADYTVIPDSPLGPATQSVTQSDGQRWSFSHPASGKITLLYFGFTSCPDVCPTTMASLATALRRLPSNVTNKVQVQFVSTDPERDTPARLHAWIDQFNPTFQAARAPIETVIAAARTYGIFIEKPSSTRGDYQVTHGAQIVVLDRNGGEVGFFGELASVDDYAKAVPTLVAKYA